jgi:hypothetical protein
MSTKKKLVGSPIPDFVVHDRLAAGEKRNDIRQHVYAQGAKFGQRRHNRCYDSTLASCHKTNALPWISSDGSFDHV